MLSPLVFANNFIKRSLETGISVSPMKMQKLLYFLYARFYANHNIPLFSDQFEKWPYGPVLSEVYTEFKAFGSRPIDEFYINSGGEARVADENNPLFLSCFNEVWDRFGPLSGIDLSKLTHQEGSAWCKTERMGSFLKAEDIANDGKRYFA